MASAAPSNVVVAQYTPADGWGAPQTIQGPAAQGPAGIPQLAVGTGGDLAVGWLAGTELVTSGLENGAWTAAKASGGPSIIGSGFELAIDRPDYMLAVWIAADSAYHVTSARYTTLTGWQAPAQPATGQALASPHVVTSENGGAVAAWIDASSGQRVVTAAAYILSTAGSRRRRCRRRSPRSTR